MNIQETNKLPNSENQEPASAATEEYVAPELIEYGSADSTPAHVVEALQNANAQPTDAE